MMPAVAQVAATLSTPVVPSRIAAASRSVTGASRGANMPIAAAAASGTKITSQTCSVNAGGMGTCSSCRTTIDEACGQRQGHPPGRDRGIRRSKELTAIASMVAQNTASTGEKPSSMKTMIEISEPKWNQ